jgi:hypothetical protein
MGRFASRFRRRRSALVAEPAIDHREPEPQEPPTPTTGAEAPRPELQPEPPPDAEPQVPPVSEQRDVAPRKWNLWELERIARERAGDDVIRNEERAYLLMYLREFATADGILPTDFDGLVREAFGDTLDPAYS